MSAPYQSSKKILSNVAELDRIQSLSNDSRLQDNYRLLLIETKYLLRRFIRLTRELKLDKSVYFKAYTLYNKIKQESFGNETTLLATEILNDMKYDKNR